MDAGLRQSSRPGSCSHGSSAANHRLFVYRHGVREPQGNGRSAQGPGCTGEATAAGGGFEDHFGMKLWVLSAHSRFGQLRFLTRLRGRDESWNLCLVSHPSAIDYRTQYLA
jgi:hypothetical protein